MNRVYPVEDRTAELLDMLEDAGYMIVDLDDHDLTANLPQIAAARAMSRILAEAGTELARDGVN